MPYDPNPNRRYYRTYKDKQHAKARALLVPSTDSETWRPVVGFEGWYEVSDLGRVRRIRDGRGASIGFVLTAAPSRGYLVVSLHSGTRAKSITKRVNRLVAIAFLGPPPSDVHQVNHIDGIKAHNAAANLEWVTNAENQRHARELGLQGRDPVTGRITGRRI